MVLGLSIVRRCSLKRSFKRRFVSPTTAAEHFLSSNHTANDMQLIPIEKIFSNRDSLRKAREAFFIQKGRTLDLDGLNIREETF